MAIGKQENPRKVPKVWIDPSKRVAIDLSTLIDQKLLVAIGRNQTLVDSGIRVATGLMPPRRARPSMTKTEMMVKMMKSTKRRGAKKTMMRA